MNFSQIFEMLDIGIVILDRDLNVIRWNRWMEVQSQISRDRITGSPLFEFFPHLDTPRFMRNFKSVSTFGNFAFFSQKLHRYLFPFKPLSGLGTSFDHMQQSCTMGPLRDENNAIQYVYIMVQDVTEVAGYEQKLLEMNMRDGLTGVYNRRYMEFRLNQEFERYRRYGRPFSLIIQDIDFFKKVNDKHGHQAGDHILKSFTALLASGIRKVDVVARYGGEEFCCMLPETDLNNARKVAEVLRRKVEQKIFRFRSTDINITISQGVAELTTDIDAPERLIQEADAALYEAKENGRNRVMVSQCAK
ncbi:sensor domain-containing diguanylate cyclase [Desulfonema ishimotonii]|uniref:diguanylate cyclase n=1 Tax=Desulfonema ishimotonii TaxID=45657 RepID=A0A401G467_9BACT|nr:diguanylate cyclase [Desulfonema ishimotonii]GBC64016.1 sensor domain-containing diguanylate cyclase [Desulfonema ishimotonii]